MTLQRARVSPLHSKGSSWPRAERIRWLFSHLNDQWSHLGVGGVQQRDWFSFAASLPHFLSHLWPQRQAQILSDVNGTSFPRRAALQRSRDAGGNIKGTCTPIGLTQSQSARPQANHRRLGRPVPAPCPGGQDFGPVLPFPLQEWSGRQR